MYDELLRRFVRDHNSPGKWVAEGNHQAVIAKWRNLTPSYHEDQLGLCEFYAEGEVGFAIKGLENGGSCLRRKRAVWSRLCLMEHDNVKGEK